MFRLSRIVMASGVAAALALPVFAAPADTIRARIAAYRELGAAYKAVNDGLRGSEPQTILIQQSARQIANAATAQYTLFPAGTGPAPGVKTKAKPEIWTQPAKFKAAQDAFARQAQAFRVAANSGNAATIRTAARSLGASCKACHDQFRLQVD